MTTVNVIKSLKNKYCRDVILGLDDGSTQSFSHLGHYRAEKLIKSGRVLEVSLIILPQPSNTPYREILEYTFFHDQECCESVYLHDIDDSFKLICGEKIMVAEIVSQAGPAAEDDLSRTWTFLKLGSGLGSITLRFLGESSGYYSESVDLRIRKIQETIHNL